MSETLTKEAVTNNISKLDPGAITRPIRWFFTYLGLGVKALPTILKIIAGALLVKLGIALGGIGLACIGAAAWGVYGIHSSVTKIKQKTVTLKSKKTDIAKCINDIQEQNKNINTYENSISTFEQKIKKHDDEIENLKKSKFRELILGIVLLCCSINVPGLSVPGNCRDEVDAVESSSEASPVINRFPQFPQILSFIQQNMDKYGLTSESLALIKVLSTLAPHIEFVENPSNKKLDVKIADVHLNSFIDKIAPPPPLSIQPTPPLSIQPTPPTSIPAVQPNKVIPTEPAHTGKEVGFVAITAFSGLLGSYFTATTILGMFGIVLAGALGPIGLGIAIGVGIATAITLGVIQYWHCKKIEALNSAIDKHEEEYQNKRASFETSQINCAAKRDYAESLGKKAQNKEDAYNQLKGQATKLTDLKNKLTYLAENHAPPKLTKPITLSQKVYGYLFNKPAKLSVPATTYPERLLLTYPKPT